MTGSDRLPNFLYIGPDKAGSTWLHEVLVKHPEIYLSPAKDLYFFDRYYDRGPDWYRKHFKEVTTQPVVGEICQDYLAAPEAPARIHAVLGEPQVMVTLRDPAKRAFSSYLYMRKHGEGPDTFHEALRTVPFLLEHGRYGTQLARYRDYFPTERVHVAVFDDLQASPQQFVDDLLARLGVAGMKLSPEDLQRKLPAGRARNAALARVVRVAADVIRRLDGAELVGKVKRSPVVHRALYAPLGADAPHLEPNDEAWVRDQLRDEIAAVDTFYGLHLMERWNW